MRARLLVSLVFCAGCTMTAGGSPVDPSDLPPTDNTPPSPLLPDAGRVNTTTAPGFAFTPCTMGAASSPAAEPCGPASPCRIVADETLATSRYVGTPSLTLRGDSPVILYSIADGGEDSLELATRDASGAWTPHRLTRGVNAAYLSNEAGGGITFAAYDALTNTAFAPLAGDALGAPLGAVANAALVERPLRDRCGGTHAVFVDGQMQRVGYVSPGAGTPLTWLENTLGSGRIAFAPNGDLHLVAAGYNASYDPVLRWFVNGALRSEFPLGVNQFEYPIELGIAMRGDAAVPHVLYMSPGVPGGWFHGWLDASGAWQTVPLFADDAHSDCRVTRPTAAGQTCDEDFLERFTIDTATSDAGATRWLLQDRHSRGRWVASCPSGGGGGGGGDPDGGPLQCSWEPTSTARVDNAVEVLWLEDDTLRSTTVQLPAGLDAYASDQFAVGSARIDSSGAIHLAYIADPGQSMPQSLHHVVIGP